MLPEEYKILSFLMDRGRHCKTREIAASESFDEAIWNNMLHQDDPWIEYMGGEMDVINNHFAPMYAGMTDTGVHAFREEQDRLALTRQSIVQNAQKEAEKEKQRLQDIRRSWWQFGLRLLFDALLFLGGWILGGITFPDALARVKSLFQ